MDTSPQGNVISLAERAMAKCERRETAFVPPTFNAGGAGFGADLESEIGLLREYLTMAANRLSARAVAGHGDERAAALILRCARKAVVIGKGVERLERKLEKAKRKAKAR